MKIGAMNFVNLLMVLFLTGCFFEYPLASEQGRPIDPLLLGLWAPLQDSGKTPDRSELMMVMKYSETEYLIKYKTGTQRIYYRGYPIEVDGERYVQLQTIGNDDGEVPKSDEAIFAVAAYAFKDGLLEVRMLSEDVMGKTFTDRSAFQDAFMQNLKNPKLFEILDRYKSALIIR